ncbi:hypothetical protein JCM8097_008052 [Rhodosporidiobolus ruineniae]
MPSAAPAGAPPRPASASSQPLVDRLVDATQQQDLLGACRVLGHMHGRGMLYARSGCEGVDRLHSTNGISALTAVATADFNPLRRLLLEALLLNFDGNPAQTATVVQLRVVQGWAREVLLNWEKSGRRQARVAATLLKLDAAGREDWFAQHFPAAPASNALPSSSLPPPWRQPALASSLAPEPFAPEPSRPASSISVSARSVPPPPPPPRQLFNLSPVSSCSDTAPPGSKRPASAPPLFLLQSASDASGSTPERTRVEKMGEAEKEEGEVAESALPGAIEEQQQQQDGEADSSLEYVAGTIKLEEDSSFERLGADSDGEDVDGEPVSSTETSFDEEEEPKREKEKNPSEEARKRAFLSPSPFGWLPSSSSTSTSSRPPLVSAASDLLPLSLPFPLPTATPKPLLSPSLESTSHPFPFSFSRPHPSSASTLDRPLTLNRSTSVHSSSPYPSPEPSPPPQPQPAFSSSTAERVRSPPPASHPAKVAASTYATLGDGGGKRETPAWDGKEEETNPFAGVFGRLLSSSTSSIPAPGPSTSTSTRPGMSRSTSLPLSLPAASSSRLGLKSALKRPSPSSSFAADAAPAAKKQRLDIDTGAGGGSTKQRLKLASRAATDRGSGGLSVRWRDEVGGAGGGGLAEVVGEGAGYPVSDEEGEEGEEGGRYGGWWT